MKKAFALTLTATLLAACSGTWHGVKSDTANTVEKVGNGIEHGWDKTQSAVKKGGNAVGLQNRRRSGFAGWAWFSLRFDNGKAA